MDKKIYEYLLIPFAGVYGGVIFLRNKLFDWQIIHSNEYNIPVISVGNITVGGTGKTPHVEYLVRLLKDQYKIAVLSRGYKRNTKGFFLASENSSPDEIGDESCQLKRKFPGIFVAVDEKRRRGIDNLMKLNPGPDVIILDDAFQHRYVNPGLNILLEDFNRPISNDHLLPFGRLREFYSAKKRANIILVTKSPSSMKAIDMRIRARKADLHEFQHLYYTKIVAEEIQPLFTGNLGDIKNEKPGILLFSGIANPRSLKPFVRKLSTRIHELTYRDHHNYREQDMQRLLDEFENIEEKKKIILTTEKDSVKLLKFKDILRKVHDKIFYLPIRVEFLNDDQKNFNNQILNYVSSNKRDSILHKG
ncbi:MAG: tetraacyldisaccharide 4'-kinase [Bacteroidales bacterium]